MNEQWITVRTASGKTGRVRVDPSRPISEQIGSDWLWYAVNGDTGSQSSPVDSQRKTGCGWAILIGIAAGLFVALVAVFVYMW